MSQAISIQSSILPVTVLNIFSEDIQQVKYEIQEVIAKSTASFVGKQVVIEPKIDLKDPTFIALLVEFLYQVEMVPVGIRTDNKAIQQQTEYAGLAVLLENTVEQESVLPQQDMTALTVNNVRSGQQVYAENRDLVVLGFVNPGAEVIADGNVHIYGKIEGKVFAGVSGLKTAKIFANNLDPEMITIAGQYQLSEDIEEEFKDGFVEVGLNQEGNYLEYRRVLWQE